MLDPDPDEMNADPQPCLLGEGLCPPAAEALLMPATSRGSDSGRGKKWWWVPLPLLPGKSASGSAWQANSPTWAIYCFCLNNLILLVRLVLWIFWLVRSGITFPDPDQDLDPDPEPICLT
jgi:hypothetical protein